MIKYSCLCYFRLELSRSGENGRAVCSLCSVENRTWTVGLIYNVHSRMCLLDCAYTLSFEILQSPSWCISYLRRCVSCEWWNAVCIAPCPLTQEAMTTACLTDRRMTSLSSEQQNKGGLGRDLFHRRWQLRHHAQVAWRELQAAASSPLRLRGWEGSQLWVLPLQLWEETFWQPWGHWCGDGGHGPAASAMTMAMGPNMRKPWGLKPFLCLQAPSSPLVPIIWPNLTEALSKGVWEINVICMVSVPMSRSRVQNRGIGTPWQWGKVIPWFYLVLITVLTIFFFFLFFSFYCYSITGVCLFSPSLHPTPGESTSLPHLHPPPWFCPCVLYSSSCNPLFPLSPHPPPRPGYC